jgi:hypothetical protein
MKNLLKVERHEENYLRYHSKSWKDFLFLSDLMIEKNQINYIRIMPYNDCFRGPPGNIIAVNVNT